MRVVVKLFEETLPTLRRRKGRWLARRVVRILSTRPKLSECSGHNYTPSVPSCRVEIAIETQASPLLGARRLVNFGEGLSWVGSPRNIPDIVLFPTAVASSHPSPIDPYCGSVLRSSTYGHIPVRLGAAAGSESGDFLHEAIGIEDAIELPGDVGMIRLP